MTTQQLELSIGVALACGVLSALIAARKGRSAAGFFMLGVLIPIVGLVASLAVGRRAHLGTYAALNPYRAARAHPGWYQDPQDPNVMRWHDGVNWTQEAYDTRPAPADGTRRSRHRG